ncbi:MAG: NUDIX domain-containing protein [archaeon]
MPLPKNKSKRKYMFSDDIKFLQKIILFHPKYKNKFLVLKSSPDHYSRPNSLDLPGGNVLFGETHLDSLLKEIKEEAGIKKVKDIKPIQVVTNYATKEKLYQLNAKRKSKKIYFIFIGYTGKAQTSKIKLSHEHTEYKWITKKEFLKLKPADYYIKLVNNI